MSEFGNVAFDPETLAVLEGVFDEAWVSIQAQRNGNITRAALAERILTLAVKGERNPARLLDGTLSRSKTDAERDRLEKALEKGLRETFPASDAVAVVQPAPPEPHYVRGLEPSTPCRGGIPPLTREQGLSSFMHRPQTGNCWRKLTASSGASPRLTRIFGRTASP